MKILKEKLFENGAYIKLVKIDRHNYIIKNNICFVNTEFQSLNEASRVINSLINDYSKKLQMSWNNHFMRKLRLRNVDMTGFVKGKNTKY